MKKDQRISFIHLLTAAVIVMGIVAFGENPAALEKKAKAVVDQWVRKVYKGWVAVQQLGPGQEKYGEQLDVAAAFTMLDVDQDGDLDAVVELTSEYLYGNSWRSSLAIFRNDKGRFSYHAFADFGGKFDRDFERDSTITVTPQGIRVPFVYWGPDDAGCCPMQHSYTYFTVNEPDPDMIPVASLDEELPSDSPYNKSE